MNSAKLHDKLGYHPVWTIRRYPNDEAYSHNEPSQVVDAEGKLLDAVTVVEGNLLLNEGIAVVLDLACALASPTAFSNAAAYIGVGDSATAAGATQAGLQASTNKLYKAMETSYPSRSAQTVTWRSVFGSSEGNYAWNEFTVANGNSDSAANLNRLVSAQGTKASGQTWTVDLAITLS
jgi:hypothetical protein